MIHYYYLDLNFAILYLIKYINIQKNIDLYFGQLLKILFNFIIKLLTN